MICPQCDGVGFVQDSEGTEHICDRCWGAGDVRTPRFPEGVSKETPAVRWSDVRHAFPMWRAGG